MIKSILPYMGAKRQIAPQIVSEIPPHRAYWEPFAGSLAVLFAKEPSPTETVCDLHGGVICLARVLADELKCPQLYARLEKTLLSEDLYDEARGFLEAADHEPAWRLQDDSVGEDGIWGRADENMTEYAYWLLVESWMGRNGLAGQRDHVGAFCVRYTPTGGDGATRWRAVADSLPWWHERLRNVTILRRSAFEVLPRIPDRDDIVIYCDPPYLVKSKKYRHDFASEDHDRLATELARFRRARVLISYYEHPRLAELYPAWTKLDLSATKNMGNSGSRGAKATKAPEVLLINGPSLAGEMGSLF